MSKTGAVDFFKKECQLGPYTDAQFGILETPSRSRVDTDLENQDNWSAHVNNPDGLKVMLTIIDGCVFPSDRPPKRCDVMLTTQQSIHLIELKNRKHPAVAARDGKAQLIATIQALTASCDIKHFTTRMAHVCNKRNPRYRSNESERNFRSRYGFTLSIKVDIDIKPPTRRSN